MLLHRHSDPAGLNGWGRFRLRPRQDTHQLRGLRRIHQQRVVLAQEPIERDVGCMKRRAMHPSLAATEYRKRTTRPRGREYKGRESFPKSLNTESTPDLFFRAIIT